MLSRAFKKSADKPITNNTANGLDNKFHRTRNRNRFPFSSNLPVWKIP